MDRALEMVKDPEAFTAETALLGGDNIYLYLKDRVEASTLTSFQEWVAECTELVDPGFIPSPRVIATQERMYHMPRGRVRIHIRFEGWNKQDRRVAASHVIDIAD